MAHIIGALHPLAASVTALIGLGSILLFAWLFRRYLGELAATTRALDEATIEILNAAGHDDLNEPFPWHATRLSTSWDRFKKEWTETTRNYRGSPISTLDPADIFTEQVVFGSYNRNMSVAMAGIFTGLGILGTFIGVVIGLRGVNTTASTEVLLSSVNVLLDGMWAAFLTSILGISLSLVWLVVDRRRYHETRRACEAFFEAVRQRFPVETTDRLLHRLLEVEEEESAAIHDSKDILGEQKAILQDLSFDLASAFQKAMAESLEASLVPVLGELVEKLDGLAVNFGERQAAAMEQMAEAFQRNLLSGIRSEFDGLASLLAQTAETQQTASTSLDTLVSRIEEVTEGQLAVIEQTREASDRFASTLEALGYAQQGMRQTAERLEGAGEQLASAFAEAATGLERQASAATKAADSLAERIDELDRQHELYREANEQLRIHLATHADEIEKQVSALSSFWTNFRDDLDQVGSGLRDSISEFSVFTADKLKEIFARFDSEMATVVGHLGGTLAEVREVTESLPRNLERLRSTVDDLSGEFTKSALTLSTAMADLPKLLDALDGVAKSAEKLDSLHDAVERASGRVGTTSESLAEFGGGLGLLNETLRELVNINGRAKGIEMSPTAVHAAPAGAKEGE